jgi:hypothetical protein
MKRSLGQVTVPHFLFLPLSCTKIASRHGRRDAKATEVAWATPSDESLFDKLIAALKTSNRIVLCCVACSDGWLPLPAVYCAADTRNAYISLIGKYGHTLKLGCETAN